MINETNFENEIKKTINKIDEDNNEVKEEKKEFITTINADGQFYDMNISNFQYLVNKVEVLQEEIELLQKILQQHNMRLKIEINSVSDINEKVFKKIEG